MTGVDQIDPYPGLASFQDRDVDRLLFCGREEERRTLFNLVIGESIAVLYSRSGLGKTSLINTTLLQALRDVGYFPVVARLTDLKAGPRESVIKAIEAHARTRNIEIRGAGSPDTLWEYLVNAEFYGPAGPWKLVLIIDQFEELFTRIRERDRKEGADAEKQFIEELSNVVRHRVPAALRERYTNELEELDHRSFEIAAANGTKAGDFDAAIDCCDKERRRQLVQLLYEETGPNVKVLLSLREDYLPELEALRQSVPTIFQKMMRLDALTLDGGHKAIVQPAEISLPGKTPFTYDPVVVETMLAFLQRRKVGNHYIDTGMVDPGQLQILCQHLDRRRRERGANTIAPDDLGGDAGMQRILRRFYQDIVHEVPAVRAGWNGQQWRPSRSNFLLFHLPRVGVRTLVQNGLITRTGFRNSLMEDTIADQYGVKYDDLWRMVESKLIRVVTRLDSQFYELTHDTLIGHIRAAARVRRYKAAGIWTAIAIMVSGAAAFPQLERKYADWREQRARIELTQQVTRNSLAGQTFAVTQPVTDPDSEKSRHVQDLIRQGQVDFRNEDLSGIRLSNLTWRSPVLAGADLRRATIENSLLYDADLSLTQLPLATFRATTVLRSVMRRADAAEADFSGSTFFDVDMTELRATGTDFGWARLYASRLNGADLANADFEGADFQNVDMTNANVAGARFDGCAWWEASGWSASQWTLLLQQYSPEKLRASAQYRLGLEALSSALEKETPLEPTERASALNSRAWFRAVRGAELDLALEDANNAIGSAVGIAVEDRANIIDTRGYILLQMQRIPEAIDDFEETVRLAPTLAAGIYHLALAYEAAGKHEAAFEQFRKAEELEYVPTYERMITPRSSPPRRRKLARG